MPASSCATRVLILGGTSEATALAESLAGRAGIAATLSLAGRTSEPATQPLPMRVGGFGGAEGLAVYLREERVDMLIDATHPFAAHISTNARAAARTAGCPLIVVGRAPWRAGAGDDWHEVANMDDAVAALGAAPRRVFLTTGRQQLAAFTGAPQHFYLVRTIETVDPLPFPRAVLVTARGPFRTPAEKRLMHDHRIDVVVTKNSGGTAAEAKLAAARELGLPVILVRRPDDATDALSVAEAIAAIEAHRATAPRGV